MRTVPVTTPISQRDDRRSFPLVFSSVSLLGGVLPAPAEGRQVDPVVLLERSPGHNDIMSKPK
jgi:lipid-A-disaccharide synthase-like uncharacterized protein